MLRFLFAQYKHRETDPRNKTNGTNYPTLAADPAARILQRILAATAAAGAAATSWRP